MFDFCSVSVYKSLDLLFDTSMNRSIAEKILATVFVLALFGGIYFLIQTFTERDGGAKSDISKSVSDTADIIPALHRPQPSTQPLGVYYYVEDFYTETDNGLMLKTHSNPEFVQTLTTLPVKDIKIQGPMLEFSVEQNGHSQTQYFNLEALVNQLNNQ